MMSEKTVKVCRNAMAALIIIFAGTSQVSGANSIAVYFDGNTGIEVPDQSSSGNPSLDIVGPITMEAWVNFVDYPNCCWNTVMAKSFGSSSYAGSYWMTFSNHPLDLVSSDTFFSGYSIYGDATDVGNHSLIDAAPIRDGQWHHIASVYDIANGQTYLYLDGQLINQGAKTVAIRVTDHSFYIGTQPGADRRTFKGYIDEVRLWNVARTEAQILQYMNRELCDGEPGIAGYWNFNEGPGATALDYSGNENDGTFTGTPSWVNTGPDLASCVTEVAIDVKPHNKKNTINLGSSGVIPVAILSSDTFNALDVDPATVSLAGASVRVVGKADRQLCSFELVNDDDLLDLLCKVETEEFLIEEGVSTLVLEAQTYGGEFISGEDMIRIVP